MQELHFIEAAFSFGQPRVGVELGPETLVSFCKSHKLLRDREICPPAHPTNDSASTSIETASTALKDLSMRIEAARSTGKKVITLGGDHSIGISTVHGNIAASAESTGILWIDAHGDINTPLTSLTGNLHGMPLALLGGLFQPSNHQKYFDWVHARLPLDQLVFFGIRSLDPGEEEFIRKYNIRCYRMTEIRRRGVQACIKEAFEYLFLRCPNLHVSFDIDSLDPSIAPATGVKETGGLTFDEADILFRELSQIWSSVRSFDCVELDPTAAANLKQVRRTALNVIQLLNHLMPEIFQIKDQAQSTRRFSDVPLPRQLG